MIDNRRLRLDQFAEEDDLNGFVAFKSRKILHRVPIKNANCING